MSAEEQTGKLDSRRNCLPHYRPREETAAVFAAQSSHLSSGRGDVSSGHQVLSPPLHHIRDEIVMPPRGHLGLGAEYHLQRAEKAGKNKKKNSPPLFICVVIACFSYHFSSLVSHLNDFFDSDEPETQISSATVMWIVEQIDFPVDKRRHTRGSSDEQQSNAPEEERRKRLPMRTNRKPGPSSAGSDQSD